MVILDKTSMPQTAPSPTLAEALAQAAASGVRIPSAVFGYVAWEFEAEILVLKHSTTIRPNYQAMLHCGTVKQTVALVCICDAPGDDGSSGATAEDAAATSTAATTAAAAVLRTGDQSTVRFRFTRHPEYMQVGKRLLFREGQTRGIGKVVRINR